MNCPKCKVAYGKDARAPLLLIKCGHSVCHTCATILFDSHIIVCPECGTVSSVDSVSQLPKNMALFTMTQEQNLNGINPINAKEKQIDPQCENHQKKLEAFCNDDKCLLCINCILLDGHKSHDIMPIVQASSKGRDQLHKDFETCTKIEGKLKLLMTEIANFRVQLVTDANIKREKVTTVYKEITNIIQERESILKQNIANLLEKEESVLESHIKKIEEQLSNISLFKTEVEQSKNENDCQLLRKLRQRLNQATESNKALPNILFTLNYPDVRKENEVAVLCKLINPIPGKAAPAPSIYSSTTSSNKKRADRCLKGLNKCSQPPEKNTKNVSKEHSRIITDGFLSPRKDSKKQKKLKNLRHPQNFKAK